MSDRDQLIEHALRDARNAAEAIQLGNYLQADILLQLSRDQLIDAGVVPE